LPKRRNA